MSCHWTTPQQDPADGKVIIAGAPTASTGPLPGGAFAVTPLDLLERLGPVVAVQPTKVTAEISGIEPAVATGLRLGVPVESLARVVDMGGDRIELEE